MRLEVWHWFLAVGFLAGCTTTVLPAAVPSDTPAAEAPSETPLPVRVTIKKYPGNFTCFKIVTSRNVIIVTDPFGMNEDVPADIVTISHDHGDHNDLRHIQPAVDPIQEPGEYSMNGIHIIGAAGHHNKGDTTTTNVIFVFDMDGIRLAQFASQADVPSAEMFAAIGKVDILIIQMIGNGYEKLSAGEAGEIVHRLEVKIIIPAHGDPTQTEVLAALLNASNERIASGSMTVAAADLATQKTPRVVTLDNPGWSP